MNASFRWKEIMKNIVYESAYHGNADLLYLLHNNEQMQTEFFTVLENGTEIFNAVKFGWVISNRQFLPDSYTRFANKIGLADSKEDFISNKEDVVLVFPHKDCILEGGQAKEDQKR